MILNLSTLFAGTLLARLIFDVLLTCTLDLCSSALAVRLVSPSGRSLADFRLDLLDRALGGGEVGTGVILSVGVLGVGGGVLVGGLVCGEGWGVGGVGRCCIPAMISAVLGVLDCVGLGVSLMTFMLLSISIFAVILF